MILRMSNAITFGGEEAKQPIAPLLPPSPPHPIHIHENSIGLSSITNSKLKG